MSGTSKITIQLQPAMVTVVESLKQDGANAEGSGNSEDSETNTRNAPAIS